LRLMSLSIIKDWRCHRLIRIDFSKIRWYHSIYWFYIYIFCSFRECKQIPKLAIHKKIISRLTDQYPSSFSTALHLIRYCDISSIHVISHNICAYHSSNYLTLNPSNNQTWNEFKISFFKSKSLLCEHQFACQVLRN